RVFFFVCFSPLLFGCFSSSDVFCHGVSAHRARCLVGAREEGVFGVRCVAIKGDVHPKDGKSRARLVPGHRRYKNFVWERAQRLG
ncbi:Uncharacterized protein DAT39_010261, partial [Clarias magur]